MNTILIGLCLFVAVAFAGSGLKCNDAIDLHIGELYIDDTSKYTNSAVKCGTYRVNQFGAWYHYVGQGKGVRLNTCDVRTMIDSIIMVFDSCDAASGYIDHCVAMDDDGCQHKQSSVQFTAESLHHYYIYVTGYQNDTGAYVLATDEVRPPDNYQCHNAIDVQTFPFSATGETGTCLAVRDTCQNEFSSGLWYKVHGTGAPFVAHTCNQNTNYDSVIAVFSECTEEGGADGCVVYNNDACYRSSLVSWRSVQNSVYWVFVTGFNNARGRFTLAIEQRSMNPHSYCYEAIPVISLPFYYSGQTDYLDTTFSECRNEDLQHSMFFSMRGSNRKIVATTCTSSSTVNDSVIDVYSECEPKDSSSRHPGSGKICIASNDDYCGLGAQVVFLTNTDTYYIAVSSVSPTIKGVSFSLAITPYEDTPNTQCWFAKDVESFPDLFTGNTSTITDASEQSCDGTKTRRRGGWYRYTHSGDKKTITVSTCNEYNALDAIIEVYNDCNDMACVAQSDPNAECAKATFVAEGGKTYNMFITAKNPSGPGGYYQANFYEEAPSTHGTCENAYFVNRGALPYRVEENTILAPMSYSDCDNKTKKGIWVAVIGTGNKIVATTCDSHTGFDTVLELFDHCPEEKNPHPEYCRETNDDSPSCGRSSEIEWATQSGAYYYLFVTGYASLTGTFVLKLYEKVSMINAKCNTAVGIRNLPYYDYGLTTYCDMSNASCTKHARKGNWYEIVGNDHWVTISTCNAETDYATEIEVYLSCSEDGSGEICVSHSHDYKCSPKTEITFAAIKNQLFYILITGVDEAVMSEGFFGMTVTQGDKLPSHLSSSGEEGYTGWEIFGICIAAVMGCGVVVAAIAVGYGIFKRRHVSYQEINSSE